MSMSLKERRLKRLEEKKVLYGKSENIVLGLLAKLEPAMFINRLGLENELVEHGEVEMDSTFINIQRPSKLLKEIQEHVFDDEHIRSSAKKLAYVQTQKGNGVYVVRDLSPTKEFMETKIFSYLEPFGIEGEIIDTHEDTWYKVKFTIKGL